MTKITELKDKIFSIDVNSFEQVALEIFQMQAVENPVYKAYLNLLKIKPEHIKTVADIPHLPVQLFKTQKVQINGAKTELIFESSSTTGRPSFHYVADAKLYEKSILQGFELFFGKPEDYIFLALLPSYLERKNASLVYMTDLLMKKSNHQEAGYYLYEHENLLEKIKYLLNSSERKIFLIGVSYALLDFAQNFPVNLSGHIIMETGGMKGRHAEMIRPELHDILKKQFNMPEIASEYGMTELLSQAYAKEAGNFYCPPWMQYSIRERNDPFSTAQMGQVGAINIIDLANLYSCSFLALEDLGRINKDSSLEVLGRFDNAEIRGCSLMYF